MRSAAWNELKTTLKLQVRETFSCTILRESAAKFFFSSGEHESWSGIIKACNPLVCCGWCLILDLVQLHSWAIQGFFRKSLECPCDLGFSLGFCCWRKKEQLKLKAVHISITFQQSMMRFTIFPCNK